MRAAWSAAGAALRQWGYPRALRIDAPPTTGTPGARLAGLQALVGSHLALPGPAPAPAPSAAAAATAPAAADESFLCRLGTLSWRLGILVGKVSAGPSTGSLRNRVEALGTLLAQQGLEITDFSGRDFDPGELWDEVIGEDLPDDARPYIASMQMPRLRHHGRVLQRGVPIVKDRRTSPDPGAPS